MSGLRPARPGRFIHRRVLPHPPEMVFTAFSDIGLRRRWYRLPGEGISHTLDFVPGGGEAIESVFRGGDHEEKVTYRSRFIDIARPRRILLTYEAFVDETRQWCSVTALDFNVHDGDPATDSTELVWSEAYQLLSYLDDGHDESRHLEMGVFLALNGLTHALETHVS